jgi:hypothetical protein
MNDLSALVDDATPERVPDFDKVLARRDQRHRRRRGTIVGTATAAVLVCAGLAVVLGSPNDDRHPAPAPTPSPMQSTSPTPTQGDPPHLSYTWSDTPSEVIVRLPDRDVPLKTWRGCWRGPGGDSDCVEEAPPPVAELPDVGSPEAVSFWFGTKGWTFDAKLTRLDSECPRAEDTRTVSTGAHWFRLDPAGFAGDYRVDLVGHGPHADHRTLPTNMSFVWHTTRDGPVDQPRAHVSEDELMLYDLGSAPTRATAEVTITDAKGARTTRRLPAPRLDDHCRGQAEGYLLFQGDFVDPAIPELGPGPYSYRVRLTLDGTGYLGTAGPDGRVTWSPTLPPYAG